MEPTELKAVKVVDPRPWLFKPGQSGNPAGRPKKKFSISASLEKVLQEKDPRTKMRNYKLILKKAVDMAVKGDSGMIQYLINRIEGVPQGLGTTVNNIQVNNYSMEDRLEAAYHLVANNNQMTIDEVKERLRDDKK